MVNHFGEKRRRSYRRRFSPKWFTTWGSYLTLDALVAIPMPRLIPALWQLSGGGVPVGFPFDIPIVSYSIPVVFLRIVDSGRQQKNTHTHTQTTKKTIVGSTQKNTYEHRVTTNKQHMIMGSSQKTYDDPMIICCLFVVTLCS